MQRNCPNCGAPYDVSSDTCPYCKTSYFDMSAIDINGHQPFYIKIRIDDLVFTSKVIADPEVSIDVTSDQYCVEGRTGYTLVQQNRNCDINLTLHSVPEERCNLFTIKEIKC